MPSAERKKKRVLRRRLCEGCGGSGVRAPAVPSCRISARRGPWIVVERCDSCELYSDDLAAALACFLVAGWFRCSSGGEHALADSRTRNVRPRTARRSTSRSPFAPGSL
jgi:hypothetical protein